MDRGVSGDSFKMEGYGQKPDYRRSSADNPSGSTDPAVGSASKYPPPPRPNPPASKPTNWATADVNPSSSSSLRELCHRHMHEILAYCSVFWSFGMCVAFLGPTLLDLGCITSTDMKTISWVFFAQLLCSLIGSIAAGYLAQRVDANMVLTIAAAILPIAMFIIPFCRVLVALGLVLAIMGLNMGCIDCLANLQMIQIFGENVSPFLQAMHFFYGLGAFVSPMIAEPFLLNEDCTYFIDNITNPTPAPGMVYDNSSFPADSLEEAQEMTKVKYAFWILGALQLPIPLIMGSLLMRMRLRGMHRGHERLIHSDSQASGFSGKKDYENIDKQKGPDWINATAGIPRKSDLPQKALFSGVTYQVISVAVATAGICFIYDGLQSAFGGYVYSYAVKSIVDLNKTEGAYLNACFWGTFALGRLLSIFGATRLSPGFMLLCNIIGCMVSMIVMLSLRHDHIALYFGTCFFGIFISSITPTTLSLAEQYIDVTSKIMAFIVVIAALGEMLFPVIVGNIFVTLGPVSFLWFGNIACLASILVFLALWFIGHSTPKFSASGSSSFVWAHLCCLRPQTEDTAMGEEAMVNPNAKYYSQATETAGNFELSHVDRPNGMPQ